VPLPDQCPVCSADLMHVNVPGPEGRPERVDCMGRQQHSWLVVDQGTPELPDYVLDEELTPAATGGASTVMVRRLVQRLRTP
jgi:hypothetical protein